MNAFKCVNTLIWVLSSFMLLTMDGERSSGSDSSNNVTGVTNVYAFILRLDVGYPQILVVSDGCPANGHFPVVTSPKDFGLRIASNFAFQLDGRFRHRRDVWRFFRKEWFDCNKKQVVMQVCRLTMVIKVDLEVKRNVWTLSTVNISRFRMRYSVTMDG